MDGSLSSISDGSKEDQGIFSGNLPTPYQKPKIEDNFVGQKENKKKNKKGDKLVCTETKSGETSKESSHEKVKYVPLYQNDTDHRDVVLIPGRHKCDCEASKHKLINNCLKCGRIVCQQEGSGPCSFCGSLVVSPAEQEILNQGTSKSQILCKKLLGKKNSQVHQSVDKLDDLKKAVEHKNKLIEFDRTSKKRTKVYDDDNDYFTHNLKWLSDESREKIEMLQEKIDAKKRLERTPKYTIDILGRKVYLEEEGEEFYDAAYSLMDEILQSDNDISNMENVHETLNVSRPYYTGGNEFKTGPVKTQFFNSNMPQIQDKMLLEMSDPGLCLSLHQPWASLLVSGVKVHEGRTWYSSHRGTLWIAATSKTPTKEDIQATEQLYSALANEPVTFPQYYPSSCLLGFVTVDDVLPQEEYRKLYPDGESTCPYVFICSNPQELFVKIPIKGKHKIYKIDSHIHQAAKKALLHKV